MSSYSEDRLAELLGALPPAPEPWVAAAAALPESGSERQVMDQLHSELLRLREENRVLRDERELLKRATAFFVRECESG